MSGFWYTSAIASTASALLILTGKLPILLENAPLESNLRLAEEHVENETAVDSSVALGILIEQNANRANFEQAIAIAREAGEISQAAQTAPTPEASLAFTRQEKDLWLRSLQKLSAIPQDALIYKQANDKKFHYKALLASAEEKILAADSAFLADIVKNTKVSPTSVHITLCQIDIPGPNTLEASNSDPHGEARHTQLSGYDPNWCRHYQGGTLLASPASLIKLPIAIAVLNKIHTEKLEPSHRLYIEPQNFTENATGATIEVDKEYPLVQVMDRMISESNNIATNQLIDYVGRESINKTLKVQGYEDTFVDYKLAGDRILPPNPGTQSNRITTNDVTAMMVNTYRLSQPGDDELLKALLSQKDQELGYQALQDVGSAVEWIGEKTGQNNRMLGTTLAMKIDSRRYALTVALDHSADAIALRELIKSVTNYLVENGPIATELDQETAAPPPTKSVDSSPSKSTSRSTSRFIARSGARLFSRTRSNGL